MNAPARTDLSLADVLEVENDPALLEIRCPDTGIPLWTMLRIPFLRSIMSDALYGTPMVGATVHVPKAAATLALGRAIAHNRELMRRPGADVLIAATGVGNVVRGGQWFNRLSDHFALANPEHTVVLEDFFAWRWPFPRLNGRVLLSAPTQAAALLVGIARCDRSQRERAAALIELVSRRAHDLLGWNIEPARAETLRVWLARKSAAMPWLYRRYRTLLQRVGPRLVIKEEACYGPSAVFIRAARDLGIATAEYQHGVISAGHDAYNVAEAMHASMDYRRTLPDYLLGYGRWWLDQINMPVQRIALGNPHRSEQLLASAAAKSAAGRDVLVLGDGIETELYLGLARRLAKLLDERFPVVFRPHPLERASVEREFPNGWSANVRIDASLDIYQAFRTSRVVVSELSTGLFEAVGIMPSVFVWNTAKARFTFPRHPFATFDDEHDLCRQLVEDKAAPLDEATNISIWQPDWRANYLRFLATLGCATSERPTA